MQNYNFLQKNLHRLVLGNSLIKKTLFEIEKSLFYKKQFETKNQQHVFVPLSYAYTPLGVYCFPNFPTLI